MMAYQSKFIGLILIFTLGSAGMVLASNSRPLSFDRWKEIQINEARNQVVRLSNRVKILRSDHFKLEEAKRVPGGPSIAEDNSTSEGNPGGVQVEVATSSEKLEAAELEMKSSLEALQYSKELQFSDYLQIYVKNFSNDPKQLSRIAKVLTPEQVTELLSVILRGSTEIEAPKKAPMEEKIEEKTEEKVADSTNAT